MSKRHGKHGSKQEWSSGIGFIIACVGSAVGLGNLWKFPYITYENGGGAFVFIYLLAILVVGFPIILGEMIIGRHGHANIFGTFKSLSKDHPFWKGLGIFLISVGALILSFYSVVAGWTLEYFIKSLSGELGGLTVATVGKHFGSFVGNGWKQVFYHTLFMGFTAFIILKGTRRIEQAVKILMPVLFVLIFVIMGISLYNFGAGQSLSFLFDFDFSKLTSHSVLEAVGHAFFTLSLGMGIMIIYGSYLPKKIHVVRAGLWIVFFDTFIALMACMMMYPIIFGTNMEVKESAAMLFTTLTVQFNALPGGGFISAGFYMLVAFAALSSTISLLEPVVSYISEEWRMSRKKATALGAGVIWLLGVGCALSNGASEFFTKLGVMDKLDYFTSNWGLTVGGILISIFAGWILTKQATSSELEYEQSSLSYRGWLFCVRYLSPLFVLIVILYKLNLF